jgi:hypothetical protein
MDITVTHVVPMLGLAWPLLTQKSLLRKLCYSKHNVAWRYYKTIVQNTHNAYKLYLHKYVKSSSDSKLSDI